MKCTMHNKLLFFILSSLGDIPSLAHETTATFAYDTGKYHEEA